MSRVNQYSQRSGKEQMRGQARFRICVGRPALGYSKLMGAGIKLGLFQNFLEQSYDELDHYILNIIYRSVWI